MNAIAAMLANTEKVIVLYANPADIAREREEINKFWNDRFTVPEMRRRAHLVRAVLDCGDKIEKAANSLLLAKASAGEVIEARKRADYALQDQAENVKRFGADFL